YRIVVAWSNIPMIASTLPVLLASLIYGNNAVSDNFVPDTTIITVAYFTVLVLQLIFAFWSLSILVTGIMHIQQFSVWKAIVNAILPILVFFVLILLFLMIFGLI